VAVLLGGGTPGYVAGWFNGAEEEPKTQERRPLRKGGGKARREQYPVGGLTAGEDGLVESRRSVRG